MHIKVLKRIPIFSSLKSEDLNRLQKLLSHHSYPKDSLIFIEKDVGNSMFLIHKGRVKISRMSEEGREVILAILRENDFFGEISLLDGMPRSASVTALEDTEMFMLKREDFLNLLKRFPKISIALLKELARRMRHSDSQIKTLSLLNAPGRIAFTIIQMAEAQSGSMTGDVTIRNSPRHQVIANMAGTSRETVSRFLKKFESEGYLEYGSSKIRIFNLQKFRDDYIEN